MRIFCPPLHICIARHPDNFICNDSQTLRTAPLGSELTCRFRVIHPFHPLCSHEYEVLEFRRDWGRHYVAFYDESERVVTIPIAWTDLDGEEDPFVVLSERRAYFRPVDLLALADLIEADALRSQSVGVGNAEKEARNV